MTLLDREPHVASMLEGTHTHTCTYIMYYIIILHIIIDIVQYADFVLVDGDCSTQECF